jgi:hypothetical protein
MANVDIDIDASELDKVQNNLNRLGRNLAYERLYMNKKYVEDLRLNILASIPKNFENTRTDKKGQESLLDAFSSDSVKPSVNGGFRITTAGSTADHALPLEVGISEHIIEGNPWLKFTPENITDYPEHRRDGEGNVLFKSVLWKPDKKETATGYNYIGEAQANWAKGLDREVKRDIQEILLKSGYK